MANLISIMRQTWGIEGIPFIIRFKTTTWFNLSFNVIYKY